MPLESNQPYQRVSENNEVYDEALIGSAIAAGGAGAGVFGARMHYNGIDRRAQRHRESIEQGQRAVQETMEQMQERGGNVSLIDRAKERLGNRQLQNIETRRQREISDLELKNEQARGSINDYVHDPQMRQEADEARRSAYGNAYTDVNQRYDEIIDDSTGKRWVDEVQTKRQRNLDVKLESQQNLWNSLEDERLTWTGEALRERKENHLYRRRMGGWRNAGIIGASAVIGAGLGAGTGVLTNHLNERSH